MEGIVELGKSSFMAILVRNGSGKNHPWMPNTGGLLMINNSINGLQVPLGGCLLAPGDEKTVENWTTPLQMIKISITKEGKMDIVGLWM